MVTCENDGWKDSGNWPLVSSWPDYRDLSWMYVWCKGEEEMLRTLISKRLDRNRVFGMIQGHVLVRLILTGCREWPISSMDLHRSIYLSILTDMEGKKVSLANLRSLRWTISLDIIRRETWQTIRLQMLLQWMEGFMEICDEFFQNPLVHQLPKREANPFASLKICWEITSGRNMMN